MSNRNAGSHPDLRTCCNEHKTRVDSFSPFPFDFSQSILLLTLYLIPSFSPRQSQILMLNTEQKNQVMLVGITWFPGWTDWRTRQKSPKQVDRHTHRHMFLWPAKSLLTDFIFTLWSKSTGKKEKEKKKKDTVLNSQKLESALVCTHQSPV